MDESPAFHVDIESLEGQSPPAAPPEASRGVVARPWLGIRFDCCGVYTRVYRNAEGTAYLGRCPRCLRKVSVIVGPGGSSSRFFVAE